MRRVAPMGVLLCGIVSLLAGGCSDDSPTASAAASQAAPSLATAAASCEPRTRPGKIVEKVITPPAWGIAVRDDGLTYFTQPFADGVGITKLSTRTVDGFIGTGDDPIGAAFSPDGNTAYVTNLLSHDVSIIDVLTGEKVGTISTGDLAPFVVRVSPDGERLFVATASNAVLVISTATREIIKTVTVGSLPNGFAVHPDGRMMYISSFQAGTVAEVDLVTEQVLRTFAVGGTPQDMALNRKGSRLYIANEAGYLNEIDLFTGEQLPNIPLAGGGFGVGVTPDDGEAYVSEPRTGLVQVFSLQTRKLTRTIEVGGEPRRLGFSQQGKIGAVANMAGYLTFVR